MKWYRHCCTCGRASAKPRSWAYCSKRCEIHRRGRQPAESTEYLALVDELLAVEARLRCLLPAERELHYRELAAYLRERMVAMQREQAEPTRPPRSLLETQRCRQQLQARDAGYKLTWRSRNPLKPRPPKKPAEKLSSRVRRKRLYRLERKLMLKAALLRVRERLGLTPEGRIQKGMPRSVGPM